MEQQKKRCVVYTRKSHEEGLDQAFNSLDAQRQACESYIQSQQFNGWELMPKRYDDGGFSGGYAHPRHGHRHLCDSESAVF